MANRKFKATKNGTLSDPYMRVKEGQVVTLPEDHPAVSGPGKASWLEPLETFQPQPKLPTTPYMDDGAPPKPTENQVPPAPVGTNYANAMADIQAAEAVQDGNAADLDEGRAQIQTEPGTLQEVQPGKFVGEAVPVKQEAPAPAAPETPAEPVETETEGTGNQDVLG